MHAVFAAHPDVESAILLGSRTNGSAKPGSDIDLVQFESISNPDLREHITRVGQIFYAPLALAA